MKLAASLIVAIAFGTPALAEDLAPVALNSLSTAPAKIAAAPVLDQTGRVIGKVGAVVHDQDGRPSALSYVTAADNQVRVIGASAASYDAQKNLVVADTSQAQTGERVAVN